MREAGDDPYEEEKPGTHKNPVAHDRRAVIFWLEHRILPALNGPDAASIGSGSQRGPRTQEQLWKEEESPSGDGDSGGQGYMADAKKRRALELYAMEAAIRYYQDQWQVRRVSHTKKVLDLRIVHRVSGEVRHVEVKGSSQSADKVEVTKAEVEYSRKRNCELFVLDKIKYHDTGPGPDAYECRGGRRRVGRWCPDSNDLTPKTYDYALGADFGKAATSLARTPRRTELRATPASWPSVAFRLYTLLTAAIVQSEAGQDG